MLKYKKKDILEMPEKDKFVSEVKTLADEKLSHLFMLTKDEINNVLTALSIYCEDTGAKANEKIYEDTLLQMIQYQENDCGHRFEHWAL